MVCYISYLHLREPAGSRERKSMAAMQLNAHGHTEEKSKERKGRKREVEEIEVQHEVLLRGSVLITQKTGSLF